MTQINIESFENTETYNKRIDSNDRTFETTPLTVSFKTLQNFAIQVGFRSGQIQTTDGIDFFSTVIAYTLEKSGQSITMSKDFEHSKSSIRTWQSTLLGILAVEVLGRKKYKTPYLFQSADELYYVGFEDNDDEQAVLLQADGTSEKKLTKRQIDKVESDLGLVDALTFDSPHLSEKTLAAEKQIALSIFDEDNTYTFQNVPTKSDDAGQNLVVDLDKVMVDYYAAYMFFLLRQPTETIYRFGNHYLVFETEKHTIGLLEDLYEELAAFKDYYLNQATFEELNRDESTYKKIKNLVGNLKLDSFFNHDEAFVGGDGTILL